MHTPSQGPELDLCFALDIMHCFLYLRLRKYIAMVLCVWVNFFVNWVSQSETETTTYDC